VDERLRSDLLREIRDFLEGQWPSPGSEGEGAITDRQLRLAAAVLMVALVRADGRSVQDEHRALERALGRALELGPEEAGALTRAAEEASADPAAFGAVLDSLDRGSSALQRLRLVEALWRIAFADAELAGHEEYLVRKVAGRLGLSTADLVEAKIRARETFLREDL
jgi:uncharacterized tellurite resistance protein B-like protein